MECKAFFHTQVFVQHFCICKCFLLFQRENLATVNFFDPKILLIFDISELPESKYAFSRKCLCVCVCLLYCYKFSICYIYTDLCFKVLPAEVRKSTSRIVNLFRIKIFIFMQIN